MIQVKPKVSTLFSIGVFLIISFGIFFYTIYSGSNSLAYSVIQLILVFTTGPIAVAVTLKTLWGLKLLEISKEKFIIKYPFRFTTYKFIGKDIEYWKLEKIKTYGGEYEELIWQLKNGKKYAMSKQEHTAYDKALNYMLKKFKKLKQ